MKSTQIKSFAWYLVRAVFALLGAGACLAAVGERNWIALGLGGLLVGIALVSARAEPPLTNAMRTAASVLVLFLALLTL